MGKKKKEKKQISEKHNEEDNRFKIQLCQPISKVIRGYGEYNGN